MIKPRLLKSTLINFSIGNSAVRNQGNGIASVIRDRLKSEFSISVFMKNLKSRDDRSFLNYLDSLTDKLTGLKGESKNRKPAGRVKWGTARKCTNLLLRSTVYNAFVWHEFEIKMSDFECGAMMDKLEVPLDSYVVNGIIRDCTKKYKSIGFDKRLYPKFSIIGLEKGDENSYYQDKALLIASRKKVCRVDLDIYYWRNQEEK